MMYAYFQSSERNLANMSIDKQKFFFGSRELETALLDGDLVVRDTDDVWRYASTWIAVPGARDITLTERFKPKYIVDENDEIERVVIAGEAVDNFPDLLGWCLEEGTPIREDDALVEVIVPWGQWQERSRVPGELFSPEHHGSEAECHLAAAERRYREAESSFETAARERAQWLRKYADEMTRQEAREITGLSVGRIQQLIRSEGSPDREILELFVDGPVPSLEELLQLAQKRGSVYEEEDLRQKVYEMKERGFLSDTADKDVQLTDAGMRALLEARVLGDGAEKQA